MLEQLAEQIIEDEALTDGLSDQDASELVGWMIELVEDFEQEANPLRDRYFQQLKRLGHEIAQLSRRYEIPVDELIDLIETAWEEPEHPQETKPIQA